MTIELKNCPLCEKSDWHSLDYMRDQSYWYVREFREENEPVGFKVCKQCGFVTYDYIDDKRLQESYDRQRPSMTANHIVTCNRKNGYHKKFFENFTFQKNWNILDFGCAQGYFLNWLKENYGCENIFGTEHASNFMNYGVNEYGIINHNDIYGTAEKFYDFISCYHVYEHVQNPGIILKNMRDCLKDDGYIYLSVPIWFDKCEESDGSITANFENYYHLNHINVFSFNSFHNFLKKYGLEIIHSDNEMYCYTVLCKKCKPSTDYIIDSWVDIENDLKLQIEAIKCLREDVNTPGKSYEIYPKFPDGYILHSLDRNNMKVFENQIAILEKGIANVKSWKLVAQLARVYFQWDENNPEKQFYSNNIKKAEALFKELLTVKPHDESFWYFLGVINWKYKKDKDEALKCFNMVKKINPMKFGEAENMKAWIYKESI